MTTSDFLKDIQKTLDGKKTRLCLEGYTDETCFAQFSMKDFIYKFLSELCKKHKTIYHTSENLHCKPAQRRSVSDIYRLCKFYYSNVTLEEVMVCLSHLDKEQKIGYFFCNETKSRVWMEFNFWKAHTVNPFKYHEPDEFNITPAIITELSNLKY